MSRGFFMRVNKITSYVVLGLCMVPFILGLHGPFMLDDTSNLNLARASTNTWNEILNAIFNNESGLLRRPIANLSFLLTYNFIGNTPFDYKIVNLLLHGINSCVLWRLAIRVSSFIYPEQNTEACQTSSLLIAVLWAIHPIQVSTVLYAVQRMAELSALFTMLALLLFFRLSERPAQHSMRSGVLRSMAVGALALCGLLSKENAVLFPCFLMVIYFSAAETIRRAMLAEPASRIQLALCGWIPIIIGSVGFAFKFSWFAGGYAMRDFTLSERIFTEPFIVFRYLGTVLVPNIKHMGLNLDDMPVHNASEPLAWLVLFLILLMPAIAFAIRKKAPALTFAILWFLTAHLLESTVIPLELAFEHRNYVALFGPMFAIGHYLFSWLHASRLQTARLAVIVPIAILVSGTAVRAHQWSNSDLFVQQEAENHPLSPRAQNAAIDFDLMRGDIEKVKADVSNVQALKPDAFWPMTLDFNLACGIPGHVVQWNKIEAQIRKRPSDIAIPGMLLFDTSALTTSNCHYLDIERFDEFLTTVADIYGENKMPDKVEKMLILRSHIAAFQNRTEQAISLLNAAAEINPQGLQAIHELAYYALNIDNLDIADKAIIQLQSRINRYSPHSQYDADELRGYLTEARAKKSTPTAKPSQ
jgi:tetratricopeptide (TPR) repeat protein